MGEVATEAVGLRLHLSSSTGHKGVYTTIGASTFAAKKWATKWSPRNLRSTPTAVEAAARGTRAAVAYARPRAVGEYPLAVTEAEGMQLCTFRVAAAHP